MNYRYQEITSREHLIQYFRLRYEVYRNSRVAGFLTANKVGLDVDQYDLQSTHFGLFALDNGQQTLVGGLRNIDTFLHRDKVSLIGDLIPGYPGERVGTLPADGYGMDLSALRNQDRYTDCEASRLVLKPCHQNRQTSHFLIMNALTQLFNRDGDIQNFVAVNSKFHSRYYQRLGFQKINEAPVTPISLTIDLLSITPDDLSIAYQKQVKEFASQLILMGYSSLNLRKPNLKPTIAAGATG